MTVMTAKHFTGACVAIDRVLQKQNNDNPNQKVDGPLLLSYAQTPQGSEIKSYIHKFAQNGLMGWAEEFGNKINVINHREIIGMKRDVFVAQKVHDALTQCALSSIPNGNNINERPSFDIKQGEQKAVIDKIEVVVHEIANHGDRVSQAKLQTVINDGLDKVLNNPEVSNKLVAEAVTQYVSKNDIKNDNTVDSTVQNRKTADNSLDLG